jgi:hypothetical protein
MPINPIIIHSFHVTILYQLAFRGKLSPSQGARGGISMWTCFIFECDLVLPIITNDADVIAE